MSFRGARKQVAPWVVRAGPYVALSLIVLCGMAASLWAAPGLRGGLGAVLAAIMLVIAAVDARRFIIPDELNIAALGFGIFHAGALSSDPVHVAVAIALLRGLVLGLLAWGLQAGYRRLRDREGIGLGDVKLAAVAGVWLDWLAIAVALEVAALAALLVIGCRAVWGHRVTGATLVPFGLFLAPAIWLAWLIEVLVL